MVTRSRSPLPPRTVISFAAKSMSFTRNRNASSKRHAGDQRRCASTPQPGEYATDFVAGENDRHPLRSLGAHQRVQPPDGYVHHIPIQEHQDRKSTRLNSSHVAISYAVFCLKKKKE